MQYKNVQHQYIHTLSHIPDKWDNGCGGWAGSEILTGGEGSKDWQDGN
jgi:hypothetical protein